ncbi:alpha/beta hydrolase [Leptolyngbya sp. FACHB-321]|uniref:alpha/beta hydrolase n=1 Tax=Leptolyngbya sp. FACHB-321 TaxID=2692807 RepID=UPI0016849850|nr:alpha/beta hydrolase [Leptolyngbya sp. FACHB-321]MBD2038084.1 alpha/beta hydrolase [Leptolyngbya sp. FACHB-321]
MALDTDRTRPHDSLRLLLLGKFSVGRVVRSVLFIYLALGAYAFFFADRQIFQPQPSSYQDDRTTLKLASAPNIQISAVYLPHPKATYTILYSHGNAEDLGDIRPRLTQIQAIGVNVFAYDYRGYGTSQGSASEQAAYQDIDAAYRYLTTTLKQPPNRIIAYGRSVGSGPSIDLATRQAVAGLVVESGFKSTFRVLTHVPLFPFDKFPNINKIGAVPCPMLFIHGTRDRTIPLQHGQALFDRANQPKTFLIVDGADHNDVEQVAGERYTQALRTFIQTLDQAAPYPKNSQ